MRFHDVVKQDTPRLVVLYKREEDGDRFMWGMVGSTPLLTLLGAVVRIQNEIYFRGADPCPEVALCIAQDGATGEFTWFLHPDIPLDPLVGMLETIKSALLGSHKARNAAAQQVGILGPNGQPMRG